MCITLNPAEISNITSIYWEKDGKAYKGYDFETSQYEPSENALLIFVETEKNIKPEDILDTTNDENTFSKIYKSITPQTRSISKKIEIQRGSWNIVIENDLFNVQSDISDELKEFIKTWYAPYCKGVFVYFNNQAPKNICPIIIKHEKHPKKKKETDNYVLLTAMEAHGEIPVPESDDHKMDYNIKILVGSDEKLNEEMCRYNINSDLPLPLYFHARKCNGKNHHYGDIVYDVTNGMVAYGAVPKDLIYD